MIAANLAAYLASTEGLDINATVHEMYDDNADEHRWGEEASLAYAALGEAIRPAAVLRTESVTIQAPLARYLFAAFAPKEAEAPGPLTLSDRLAQLDEARSAGLVSEEEYGTKRAALLEDF